MSERCAKTRMKDYHSVRCSRVGSMEHEGKMYCHQHYPPAVAKRNESSLIAWREKWNAEVELSNHKNAAARLLARFTASQLVNAPDVETLLAAESSINRPEEAASD